MSSNEEEWREVPDYPGVWASSLWRVHRRSRDGLESAGQRSQPTFGAQVVRNAKSNRVHTSFVVVWVGLGGLPVSRLVCSRSTALSRVQRLHTFCISTMIPSTTARRI